MFPAQTEEDGARHRRGGESSGPTDGGTQDQEDSAHDNLQVRTPSNRPSQPLHRYFRKYAKLLYYDFLFRLIILMEYQYILKGISSRIGAKLMSKLRNSNNSNILMLTVCSGGLWR